jgi:hypothetical protein
MNLYAYVGNGWKADIRGQSVWGANNALGASTTAS